MKLSTVFSVTLAVLPALQSVSAGLVSRQNNGAQRGRGGQNDGNNGGNNAGQNNGQNGGNNNGGNNGGNAGQNNGDPQASLTLDSKVIAPGFAQNGQDPPVAGQVASLTSTNNFINFCLTVPNLPITNGQQVQGGSCNPAPIGVIPSIDKMPSAKFEFPKNFATIPADQAFTFRLNIRNLKTGNFVNAQKNYFAAPQTLDNTGLIVGHSHITCDKLTAIDQTTTTNPQQFAFFKGLNDAAQNGVLTATVDKGLPAGAYRCCTINSSANHAPAIAPVAQHGSLDDCSYFTAGAGGAAGGNAGAGAGANNGQNNGANNGQNGGNGGAGANNGQNGGNAGAGANNGQNGGNAGAGANNGQNGGNAGAGANNGQNGGNAGAGANNGQNGGNAGAGANNGQNGGNAGAGANNGQNGGNAGAGAGANNGQNNAGAGANNGQNNGGRGGFGGGFGQNRGGRRRGRQ